MKKEKIRGIILLRGMFLPSAKAETTHSLLPQMGARDQKEVT